MLLVVVDDVSQVRGQPMKLRVAFARLGFSPIPAEPFPDDGVVGNAFEGGGEKRDSFHYGKKRNLLRIPSYQPS